MKIAKKKCSPGGTGGLRVRNLSLDRPLESRWKYRHFQTRRSAFFGPEAASSFAEGLREEKSERFGTAAQHSGKPPFEHTVALASVQESRPSLVEA